GCSRSHAGDQRCGLWLGARCAWQRGSNDLSALQRHVEHRHSQDNLSYEMESAGRGQR
ncbi:unnamed protein product, partial [Symbiodinium pilosum]